MFAVWCTHVSLRHKNGESFQLNTDVTTAIKGIIYRPNFLNKIILFLEIFMPTKLFINNLD